MRVCIIRAVGRLSVRADAGAIEPRLDITALPDSSPLTLGVLLVRAISAFRVLRPIQRKAAPHQPLAEVVTSDRTVRDRAAILVEAERHTIDRAASNKSIKVVRGLCTATILQTVFATAELTALRRIDTPKPDPRSMYFQRVAVNHAGLSGKIIGQRQARQKGEHQAMGIGRMLMTLQLPQVSRFGFRPVLEQL